ncbi:hypothetical protein U9M48_041662, partial [Paspalum notatum var. saurae]
GLQIGWLAPAHELVRPISKDERKDPVTGMVIETCRASKVKYEFDKKIGLIKFVVGLGDKDDILDYGRLPAAVATERDLKLGLLCGYCFWVIDPNLRALDYKCYATLKYGTKNCRKKKCGHSNQDNNTSFCW